MNTIIDISSDIYTKLIDLVKKFKENKEFELEAKLKQPLTINEFTNAIKYLRSTHKEEIHEDTLDILSNDKKHGVCRISILGKENIEQYCKKNIIPTTFTPIVITKKKITDIKPIIFDDYKIDLKHEDERNGNIKTEILNNLNNSLKGFRLKKRFSYTDKEGIYQFDLTIVKSSEGYKSFNFLSHKEFAGSNTTFVDYEMEIEMIKCINIKKCVDAFISAMLELYAVVNNEENNGEYVISLAEEKEILKQYIKLAFDKNDYNLTNAVNDSKTKPKKYFSGPQPVTLEQKNIVKPELGFITIQTDYTVTEKADGERMLLYIHNNGKCYFINNRLSINYTGVILDTITNSIIDGEYITKDINNKPVKIFAVFDIYWNNSVDLRKLPLISESIKIPSRLDNMKTLISKIHKKFIKKNINIFVKEFKYGMTQDDNIFKYCREILDNEILGNFNYKIDGLIFTPQKYPVGGSYINDSIESTGTWNKVFKWKPTEDNSIDFLVKFNNDNLTFNDNKQLYKILDLYVGYNPVQWDTITPMTYLDNKISQDSYIEKKFNVPFIPNDIYKDPSSFSQYHFKIDNINDKVYCKNGDEILDKSIVEFAYDEKNAYGLRWIPLRVREDKNDLYKKSGLPGTANDYGTAINVWKSIQNPVTKEMIIGEKEFLVNQINNDDNIYYSRTISRDKFISNSMSKFHNFEIKNNMLFKKVSNKLKFNGISNLSLFDVSCGKGGDIPKWIDNGFEKVMGVDISKDNIENPNDGVYARLLSKNNKNNKFDKTQKKYVFTTMDSSKKFEKPYIQSLSDLTVNNVLWGFEQSKYSNLNEYFNFANSRFDVVSCQFSIHYFFEKEEKLDNLIWNIDKRLKVGGYFIGTCIDGDKLKKRLSSINNGNSINGEKYQQVIWNIKKMYENNDFIEFGDSIEVYMESIGIKFKEYIVDFNVLKEKLKEKGIELLNSEEQKELNLKNSYETFDKAFERLNTSNDNDYNLNLIRSMSKSEKEYSFLNMWFIFIKRREIEISLDKKEKKTIKKKISLK